MLKNFFTSEVTFPRIWKDHDLFKTSCQWTTSFSPVVFCHWYHTTLLFTPQTSCGKFILTTHSAQSPKPFNATSFDPCTLSNAYITFDSNFAYWSVEHFFRDGLFFARSSEHTPQSTHFSWASSPHVSHTLLRLWHDSCNHLQNIHVFHHA